MGGLCRDGRDVRVEGEMEEMRERRLSWKRDGRDGGGVREMRDRW